MNFQTSIRPSIHLPPRWPSKPQINISGQNFVLLALKLALPDLKSALFPSNPPSMTLVIWCMKHETNALWAEMCARWLIGDYYYIFSITLFLMKQIVWKIFVCSFSDVMRLFIPNIDSFLLDKKLYELRIQKKRILRKSSENYC